MEKATPSIFFSAARDVGQEAFSACDPRRKRKMKENVPACGKNTDFSRQLTHPAGALLNQAHLPLSPPG